MKLKIISVHNHGDFDKEYVLLQATQDCDLSSYILADTTYLSSGKISNKLRHMHWFVPQKVNKDDFVTLWTKTGKNEVTKSTTGTPLHRNFWNLSTPVWNDDGDGAVLFELGTWKALKVHG